MNAVAESILYQEQDGVDSLEGYHNHSVAKQNAEAKITSSPPSPSSLTGVAVITKALTDDHEDKKSDAGYVIGAKKPDKRKQYKAGEDDDPEKESKLAGRIAETLKDSLCFDEISGEWFAQSNGLWGCILEKRALKIIMKQLNKELPNGYSIAKLNNVKAFLMIYLLLDKWVVNRDLLPLSNGVLNTKTLVLAPYTHQHRFNWQLPYNFDSNAKLDVIKQWLWSASGEDLESINIIRAFFKMALIGGEIQKFLELIGPGGTGKSTLLRLLVAFIGVKNHTATDLKNLETNRFEAAGLYGKRLALISDSSRYGGEVSNLKALTGGDPVRLEKKNQQQSGSFVYDGVVVVASNEAIQSADYTSGLIRRRMPVNFNRKVTDTDKAKWSAVGGIEAAMLKELPGLLNWVLAMSDTEVKKVLGGINGEMTQIQRQHLVETHKLAAWIDDNIIIKPDSVVYIGPSMAKKAGTLEASMAVREKLYANYQQWCDDCAVHPVALQRFTANVLDVFAQLHIDVKDLNKDKHGKPLKGIAIRLDHHLHYATPVTRKFLGDPELFSGDEVVTATTRMSSHGDPDDNKTLSVTNQPRDVEEF